MNKVYFEERVKAVPEDVNALHEETEISLGELIEALTGGYDTVLFEDAAPVVSHVAPSIIINIPQQWFAAAGVFCQIPVIATMKPDVPDYHSVYFVNYRTDVMGTRDRYTLSGGTVVVAPDSVIIRKPSNCRVEITSSGNPLVPPGPPTLGPDDIAYIKYCDIVWDGAILTVTHNVGALYSFPGAGITYTPHAATHLPTGSDPVQLAAPGGDPLGSRPGLMPSGSYLTLVSSLQDVLIDASIPFMTRVLSGDNSPGNPKEVTLDMLYDESLTVRDISSVKYLALNFQTGGYAGSSHRPSRHDHRHAPGESPFAAEFYKIAVDSAVMGTLVAIPAFAALAKIHATQVFWLPPLSSTDPYPMFESSWTQTSSGLIGARAHIISSNLVNVEIGAAITELGTATLAAAVAAVGGTPTWTFTSYPSRPTSGYLMVKVIGER